MSTIDVGTDNPIREELVWFWKKMILGKTESLSVTRVSAMVRLIIILYSSLLISLIKINKRGKTILNQKIGFGGSICVGKVLLRSTPQHPSYDGCHMKLYQKTLYFGFILLCLETKLPSTWK